MVPPATKPRTNGLRMKSCGKPSSMRLTSSSTFKCSPLSVKSRHPRYIAISDMPAWKMAQCNLYAEQHALTRFISTQVSYSLATRDVERDAGRRSHHRKTCHVLTCHTLRNARTLNDLRQVWSRYLCSRRGGERRICALL